MNRRKIVLAALAVALFVAWYAFRPEGLFINRRVHEEMPATNSDSKAQAIESGAFYGIVHPTQGTATIYRRGDSTLMLRFTNFKTTNGPNVHVYLVAADDAKDKSVLRADIIDLGPIKGNIGDQNYALGSDVDLSKYRAVSIWCKRFSLNFGAASLKPDHLASQY